MIDERGLPGTSPGNDSNDIYMLVCPCIIQERDILVSTKNIALVTGNVATEFYWRILASVIHASCLPPFGI